MARQKIGGLWRDARSSRQLGYLNAAACNIPSDAVLDAVIDHLREERRPGGFRAEDQAAPVIDAGRAALALKPR